jgi:hypothetical protein
MISPRMVSFFAMTGRICRLRRGRSHPGRISTNENAPLWRGCAGVLPIDNYRFPNRSRSGSLCLSVFERRPHFFSGQSYIKKFTKKIGLLKIKIYLYGEFLILKLKENEKFIAKFEGEYFHFNRSRSGSKQYE